jgi:flagellar biosynthesis protein FliQ
MIGAIDLEGGLEAAWENTIAFLPKLLGFFVILLLGFFIAKALASLLDKLLERAGFDRWVERGVLRTTFERSRFDPSDVISMIVFWGLFLVALQLAFGIWGPNPISDLIEGILAYLPNILVAVIIVVIAGAIARAVTDLLTATLSAVSGGRWIARGAGVAVLVIGIFAALNQLQVAPEIVNGLFYAMLAIVVGSAIVAVGGGGIRTMQRYWERWTMRMETTSEEIRTKADPDAGKAAVQARVDEERARARAT